MLANKIRPLRLIVDQSIVYRSEMFWEIFLEELRDTVVFPKKDDVHGPDEGVLVHAHISGHEVLGLLRAQQSA